MKISHVILLSAALALTACGTTKEDRATSAGLIGAGAGALIGSTLGAPVYGAVVGGAVGAATGALTEPQQVNLGKPWWR